MRRLAGLGVLAALIAGAALAQTARPSGPSPLQTSDPNAPMDISADDNFVYQNQRLVIYRGNAEVIQGQTRLRTPELKVYWKERQGKAKQAAGDPAGNVGDIDRIEAAGPVYYITPTQTAKGDRGLYEADPDVITLRGNVILTQGKNVMTGDKLTINQRTGESHLSMNSPGGAHGRVRAIIFPSQNQTSGQSGAKPARPAAQGSPR